MKRILFLMSLFLMMGCMATKAQEAATANTCTYKKLASLGEAVTDLSGLTDGGYYAFLNVGWNKYIKTVYRPTNGISFKLNNDANPAAANNDEGGLAVFRFHIRGEGADRRYSFETAIEGCYMKPVIDGECYAEVTDAPATFEIRTTNVDNEGAAEGVFYIKNAGDNNWFDMQNDKFVGWHGNGSHAGYKIVPVTLSEDIVDTEGYIITQKVVDGEGNAYAEFPTTKIWHSKDEAVTFAAPPTSDFYTVVSNFTSGTTTPNDNQTEFTHTVTKTGTAPVTFEDTWYSIKAKNENNRILIAKYETANDDGTGNNVWHVLTESGKSFNATTLPDYTEFNNALWSFVEDGFGVKVRNRQTGLFVQAGNGIATLTAAGTRFYFRTTTSGDFSLWNGNGNNYLGAHSTYATYDGDNGANKRLGIWGGGDQNNTGSSFGLDEVTATHIAVGKEVVGNNPNEADEKYVTSGLAADIAEVKASEDFANVTTIADLDAIHTKMLTFLHADIDPNAYYRIENVNCSKKYASTQNIEVGKDGNLSTAYNNNNNIDRVVRRVSETGAFVPMLWKLEANGDGTYKIRNANNGCLMCDYTDGNGNIDMPINTQAGGNYSFKAMPDATFSNNDGKTMFQLNIHDFKINAYARDYNDILRDYNDDNDAGNYWRLEKVTEVPVVISEAGYASVGYPFAVQVPAESGVKAYYASEVNGNVMTLEEISDGIIPAYQGAILVCEGGKDDLKLQIVTSDKTLEDNKLVAATAKRTGFVENENYLMAKDSEDRVKFLLNTITTVPANKAYLPAANVPSTSNAIAFHFGAGTTGIGSVENDSRVENVEYFDLKGRRVLNPGNGVYVTGSGKKVLIK